jgi:hypothetical protein
LRVKHEGAVRSAFQDLLAASYPTGNILFQAPERAILWQNGREVWDADLTNPDELVKTLAHFFAYQPPAYEEWAQAVADF